MKAKVAHEGNALVVHLMGRIDYEGMEAFRHTCLNQWVGKSLIFNFSQLAFVGSIGVSGFIETLGLLAQKNPEGLRLCEVGPEFCRMIQSREFNGISVFDSLELAKESLAQVQRVVEGEVSSGSVGSPAGVEGPAAP